MVQKNAYCGFLLAPTIGSGRGAAIFGAKKSVPPASGRICPSTKNRYWALDFSLWCILSFLRIDDHIVYIQKKMDIYRS